MGEQTSKTHIPQHHTLLVDGKAIRPVYTNAVRKGKLIFMGKVY